jgi:nitrogen fixation NifU-like protein
MPGLEDLYREIILDHYRSPRNRGELPPPPAVRAVGFNPLCGDEIEVYLELGDGDDERVIATSGSAARAAPSARHRHR